MSGIISSKVYLFPVSRHQRQYVFVYLIASTGTQPGFERFSNMERDKTVIKESQYAY